MHFEGNASIGDLVRVRVDSASLVALRGPQVETVDKAPRRELPRRRLTVVSA